jgi:hypothetical protein
MIARASQLFGMATANAFAGVHIDYGDEDQPVLVAQRPDGERVRVSGLSEGSRDQLFLALRLALLERKTSEPMPFIGDDLLSSFDVQALAPLGFGLLIDPLGRSVVIVSSMLSLAALAVLWRSIGPRPL